jgi:hypothetical protein
MPEMRSETLMAKQMDTIGWFIATLHQMLGHTAAARFLGQPVGDRAECILCRYDSGQATRDEVIERLGVE